MFLSKPGLSSHVSMAHGQQHTRAFNSYLHIELIDGKASRAQCTVCQRWYKSYVHAYDHLAFRAKRCRAMVEAAEVPPLPLPQLREQYERYSAQLTCKGRKRIFLQE